MIYLRKFCEGYFHLAFAKNKLTCLNKDAQREEGLTFQTQELIEEHDESAYYCCAMNQDGESYDLSKIGLCPYKKPQTLKFYEKDIKDKSKNFYDFFNQIKKDFCSSIKPHHPFLYCLNEEAEDKKDGAIKKSERIYFCGAMNPDRESYDLDKINTCPYKTKSK
jgi:hypothetical protein